MKTSTVRPDVDKEDYPDTTLMSKNNNADREGVGDMMSTVPSTSMRVEPERCKNDSRGCCVRHGCEMKVISVSCQKGGKFSKNRGYGYKYVNKKQFICRDKNTPPLRKTVDNKERFREEDSLSADTSNGFSKMQGTNSGVQEYSKKISGAGSLLDED